MNSQQLPRKALIQWVNQCFPYLVYDYLAPEQFSDRELNEFYTLCCYQMQQGEQITKRLAERNLMIQKRQEENMNKTVKGHYKNQGNYYSQSNYYAANYQYDPNYYAGYTGYDPNTNATQQQQNYDYNNGYVPQEQYYQNQNQRGQNNNYQKSEKNQDITQGDINLLTKQSIIPQKKQKGKKAKKPGKLSFAELKKAVLNCEDYSKVSKTFKNKIQKMNKKLFIHEDVKTYDINNKYSNNNKNNVSSNRSINKQRLSLTKIKYTQKVEKKIEKQEEKDIFCPNYQRSIVIDKTEIIYLEKAFKQITFLLNLITLQNFSEIKNQLVKHVINSKKECQFLVETMIENVSSEHKFALIYAELSSEFVKRSDFKWGQINENGGCDPFKIILIQTIELLFEDYISRTTQNKEKQKSETTSKVVDEKKTESKLFEEKLNAKALKKDVIGKTKFIEQLLLEQVISKKNVFKCVCCMMQHFFKHYSLAQKDIYNQIAEIYFASAVELIQKIGYLFQNEEDKASDKQFNALKKRIQQISSNSILLPLNEEELIASERFCDILNLLNKKRILLRKFNTIQIIKSSQASKQQDNLSDEKFQIKQSD